ncbi:MAG: sugar ABC transporter permease, partial [Proteobacteria bacterium]|nr:sugar ABC transporter permease [Pseudomonadota bacterium]
GPCPVRFQRLSSGFIADPFDGETLRLFSVLLGIAAAVALVFFKMRGRARLARYGMEEEPYAFFLGKNLFFAAVIVFFCYLLATYKGLPNVLIVMALLIVLYDFVTNRTTIGRRIYALGGNEKAARLSGIHTQRLAFLAFVNMGALAALAGLVFAARLNTATPKAGLGFELDVIAACFIGGASASGGVGKVMGAVIGAFIMGVMNNGMSIMGIGIDYQQVIKGLVLLAAVFLDVYNKNK